MSSKEELLIALNKFRSLKENWNSYTADIIKDSAIIAAETLIELLDKENLISDVYIFPVPNGNAYF